MTGSALGPGEVLTLLDPNAPKTRDALKLTLMALLARGILRLKEGPKKGLIRKKPQQVIVQEKAPENLGGPEVAVLSAISPLGDGITIAEAVKRLQRAFGKDLASFRARQLLPALISRGLIEAHSERFLLIFTRTRHQLTAEGKRERSRVQDLMEQARRIPELMSQDRDQALAVVAGLGSAVLLVQDIWPHLHQLDRAVEAAAVAQEAFYDFDFSAFDRLDQDLSAMDADFDAASDMNDNDHNNRD